MSVAKVYTSTIPFNSSLRSLSLKCIPQLSGLIFSILPIYYNHHPSIHVQKIGSTSYSEKLMVYLLAAQCACHGGVGSLVGAGLGGIVGVGYCSEPGGRVRGWEVPEWVGRVVWRMGGRFLEEEEPRLTAGGFGGGGGGGVRAINIMEEQRRMMEQYGGFGGAGAGGRGGGMGMGREPPEEAVTNLIALGFERDAVVEALKGCDNNVEVAANRLMG
ncbi:hypothetical protein TL16_g11452 [Triparma laevis f. inornata]|uniref:UBA domain-containing protein n=1 Tax=Triparma laevis f. inornata TaxID=1714386 RepID=A0A9W7BKR1_9STRA|nr:hypothetical protein TL16_g11452 [Triparma laevis f. inornata]